MASIADFYKNPSVSDIANRNRAQTRKSQLDELLHPVKQRQIELQATQQDREEAFQMLGNLNTALGDDFDTLAPDAQAQRYASAIDAVGQLGFDVSDAPETLSPEMLKAVRGIGGKFKEQAPKFGRVFEGVDAQGNRVFATADTTGAFKVLDGITPPADVQAQKLADQRRQEEENKKGSLGKVRRSAEAFADALSSPEAENATGVKGIVVGNISRLFGGEAGVAKARIDRASRKLVTGLAKQLGANPTDSDIKLLMQSIPSTSDDIAVWIDWYSNEFVPEAQDLAQEKGVQVDLPDPSEIFGTTQQNQPAQQVPDEGRARVDSILQEFGVK